eukprot:jgi/Galph1/5526/GphlegSOOS_G4144.1
MEKTTAPVVSGTSSHHCSDNVEEGGKPKKKLCCACPETKKQRDECILKNGEESKALYSYKVSVDKYLSVDCRDFIEAHKACLRQEGFKV